MSSAPITRLPNFHGQHGGNPSLNPYNHLSANPFGNSQGPGQMNQFQHPDVMQQYLYQQQLINSAPPIPGQVRFS